MFGPPPTVRIAKIAKIAKIADGAVVRSLHVHSFYFFFSFFSCCCCLLLLLLADVIRWLCWLELVDPTRTSVRERVAVRDVGLRVCGKGVGGWGIDK